MKKVSFLIITLGIMALQFNLGVKAVILNEDEEKKVTAFTKVIREINSSGGESTIRITSFSLNQNKVRYEGKSLFNTPNQLKSKEKEFTLTISAVATEELLKRISGDKVNIQ